VLQRVAACCSVLQGTTIIMMCVAVSVAVCCSVLQNVLFFAIIYVYIFIYTYTYVYIYTYIHIYMYVYIHIYICVEWESLVIIRVAKYLNQDI